MIKSIIFLGSILLMISILPWYPCNASDNVIVMHNTSTCYKNNPIEIELIEDLVLGGKREEGNDMLGMISDVCVDSENNIYVLDYSSKQVAVFDSLGIVRHYFGRNGQGPGEFSNPLAMAIDVNDQIAVADAGKVQIFDKTGRYIRSFRVKIPGMIRDIVVDGKGNFYISVFDVIKQNIIHKYDARGNHIASFCKSFAFGKDIDLRIEYTFAGGYLSPGSGGEIIFSQQIPYEIRKYSNKGKLLVRILRENGFMKSPEDYVKHSEGSMEFKMPPLSSSVTFLPAGFILNTVSIPSQDGSHSNTVIDLFDAEGKLKNSIKLVRSLRFACVDNQSRLYAIDNGDFPMVIRYRLMLKNGYE